MTNLTLSRRGFLVGCSAAIAGMAGARLGQVALAAPTAATDVAADTLVVIFLRGGWDALSVLPPVAGPDRAIYEKARPKLKIPTKGDGAALSLNGQLGLHPRLAPLMELYQKRHLAIVQATGLKHETRSHFDAMEFMELGTPGKRGTGSGWITRHLSSRPSVPSVIVPAAAFGQSPTSLLATERAVTLGSLDDISMPGGGPVFDKQQAILREMYRGERWIDRAGAQTLNTVDIFLKANPGKYTPAGSASYPQNEFGASMKNAAQLIKLDLGVQALSVDFGGWDTHEWQADGKNGYLPDQLDTFARGLAAFYEDLDAGGHMKYTTIAVISEFGRRLSENESQGTDHGHGGSIFVLGGNVNGGKIYGSWPGLANDQLFERTDLAITTDYRVVLSEIVLQRLKNPNLEKVFPGFGNFAPLGLVR
jgi:uncharacterized protein (DUF1501 family)